MWSDTALERTTLTLLDWRVYRASRWEYMVYTSDFVFKAEVTHLLRTWMTNPRTLMLDTLGSSGDADKRWTEVSWADAPAWVVKKAYSHVEA